MFMVCFDWTDCDLYRLTHFPCPDSYVVGLACICFAFSSMNLIKRLSIYNDSIVVNLPFLLLFINRASINLYLVLHMLYNLSFVAGVFHFVCLSL